MTENEIITASIKSVRLHKEERKMIGKVTLRVIEALPSGDFEATLC